MATSTLSSIAGVEGFIRDRIEKEGRTHQDVSIQLKTIYPTCKGLSAASVRRFCAANNIHRTPRLDQSTLDSLVHQNVMRVS